MKTLNLLCSFQLTLAAATMFAPAHRSTAATLNVTSLADNGPGTLRQAIQTATPGDTIDFAVIGTIVLTNGELVIQTNLNINGPGATNLTLDAGLSSRLMRVQSGTVSLNGLRLINGFVSGDGGAISPPPATAGRSSAAVN